MRDMITAITPAQSLLPQTITTGGGAKNTGDIDLQGCNAAAFLVHVGASGDTLSGSVKLTVKMEHADDNGAGAAGSYAAVADADILGATSASGDIIVVDSAADASKVYKVGYKAGKRFAKLTVTPSSGNTAGTPVAITIVKGHLAVGN